MDIKNITVDELSKYAVAHNYLNVSAMTVLHIMVEEKKHSPSHNINTSIEMTFKEYTTQDVMNLFSS